MLGAVVVAIVAAALATDAAATRDRVELESGTPESVVQDYAEAVLDHDDETAARWFADAERDVEDLDRSFVEDDVRVLLRDVRSSGDTARVDVVVISASGDLLSTEWSEEHTFRLRRTGADWLISGAPWPVFDCEVVMR